MKARPLSKREQKRREIEAHNRRHEMELEWRKVRPLFAYLYRLCETAHQKKERIISRRTARAIINEVLYWSQSYGDVTPYYNMSSKV